jgi:hypothetical protein
MAIVRQILDAFAAKQTSVATALLLAAMAWTVTRLADAVDAYDTLEYQVSQSRDVLADGRKGFQVNVKLINLSGGTTLESVRAQLSTHAKGVQFSDNPQDYLCAVEPPGWAGSPKCNPQGIGFDFSIDNLTPGTYVGFQARYTRADGTDQMPVLRISLPSNRNFRLLESGIATGALHHQTAILAGLVVVLFVLLVLSIVAGVREPDKKGKSRSGHA